MTCPVWSHLATLFHSVSVQMSCNHLSLGISPSLCTHPHYHHHHRHVWFSFSEITAHGGLGVETIFNQSISLSFLLITPSLLPSPLYLLSFHPLSLSVYCFRSSYFPTFPYPSLILFSFSLYPFHITLSVLCPIFPPPSLSLSHHLLLLFPSCKIQLYV